MVLILGAGLAGISCSYHLNHDCLVLEKNSYAGGHIYSHQINGFTWDEGPHVSFTKSDYVKNLLDLSVEGDFLEYPVHPTNYYKGCWIPHPAQSNLYAVPEPNRSACLASFLESRGRSAETPDNYQEWLDIAFGKKFAKDFAGAYTEKYWTIAPKELTTDWVGERVFFPSVETVLDGFKGPSAVSKHYITSVRYPRKGGYFSYTNLLRKGMNVKFDKTVSNIDLQSKIVSFTDGSTEKYSKLINTLPLTAFVKYIDAPEQVNKAAEKLVCSELLLLNFVIDHPALVDSHWLYIYDQDKYATRINFTELLSPENGVKGQSGIQVEVYFSKFKPIEEPISEIIQKVSNELLEMGLIKGIDQIIETNSQYINYANVIFDHPRKEALNVILNYLTQFGLQRESDDLDPMTNWDEKNITIDNLRLGDLSLAGRFAQWKYYWTDDCILRGKYIAECMGQMK